MHKGRGHTHSHELAEDQGMVSYSVGGSKTEERYTLVFKKSAAPSEEELVQIKIV